MKPYASKPMDKSIAIAVLNATFSCTSYQKTEKKKKSKYVSARSVETPVLHLSMSIYRFRKRLRDDNETQRGNAKEAHSEPLNNTSELPIKVLFDIDLLVPKVDGGKPNLRCALKNTK